MSCYVYVVQDLMAPHLMVSTFELHLHQLLLDLFLDAYKLGFLTLHGTHPCFVVELLQTFMMKSTLAAFTLNWVYQDRLA